MGFGQVTYDEKVPCAAYYKGELLYIFKSRADCARCFNKSGSGPISSAINRKGKIKYDDKRIVIRNYNIDNIPEEHKDKIYKPNKL